MNTSPLNHLPRETHSPPYEPARLVARPDRLSRHPAEIATLMAEFQQVGIELVVVDSQEAR